ncbi:hypothetical protein K7432_003540 [Basidiobolus ranarum]|uniref:Uncharacterized protein n=1 Tax=Basidiobolus ranarum TaxID=34480 RepID=A0ABR2W617_9FUNG
MKEVRKRGRPRHELSEHFIVLDEMANKKDRFAVCKYCAETKGENEAFRHKILNKKANCRKHLENCSHFTGTLPPLEETPRKHDSILLDNSMIENAQSPTPRTPNSTLQTSCPTPPLMSMEHFTFPPDLVLNSTSTESLISRVERHMGFIAPLSLADTAWDNVGLIIEPPKPRPFTSRVLLTSDLTKQVLDDAIAEPKIGVIVSYRPPIFEPLKRLNTADERQTLIMNCIINGISVYSPHSALDNCDGGVNDWMSRALGDGILESIVLNHSHSGERVGSSVGRILTLSHATSLDMIVARLKLNLSVKHVRVAPSPKHSQKDGIFPPTIRTIGIYAGSSKAKEMLLDVVGFCFPYS